MKPDDLYSVPGIVPVDEVDLIQANEKLAAFRKPKPINWNLIRQQTLFVVAYIVVLSLILIATGILLSNNQLLLASISAVSFFVWLVVPTWHDVRSESSGKSDGVLIVGRLSLRNARAHVLKGYSLPILERLLQERQLLHRSKATLLGGIFRLAFGATATPLIFQVLLKTEQGSVLLKDLPLLPIGSFALGLLIGVALLWVTNAQSQRILEAEMEALCDAVVARKQEDKKNARVKSASLPIDSTNKLTNGHAGLPQKQSSIQRIISRLSQTPPKP